MAAEIYRQMTRLVVVTVKEPRASLQEVKELQDMLSEAGYQGMIVQGDASFTFPDDEPIEVTIDGKEDYSGGDKSDTAGL
jgi:hypothetical protein